MNYDKNEIILEQVTFEDCLKKDCTALRKYIIRKIDDLEYYSIRSYGYDDRSKIHKIIDMFLINEMKSKEELLMILMNENDEIELIFYEAQKCLRKMKGIHFDFEQYSKIDFSKDIWKAISKTISKTKIHIQKRKGFHYTRIIFSQKDCEDCLRMDWTKSMKCIIAKMADLNLLEYNIGPRFHNICYEIEEELQKKTEYELTEIMMNENNQMQSIYSKIKAREELIRSKKRDVIPFRH